MSSFFVFVSCCSWHHCQRKSSRFGRIDVSNSTSWREVLQTISSVGDYERIAGHWSGRSTTKAQTEQPFSGLPLIANVPPRQHVRPDRRRRHRRHIWRDRASGGAPRGAPHLLLVVFLSSRPRHWRGPHRHRPLLHSGLDLFEAGLCAGFVMGTAALSAVCAAEADRPDDIVAGHYR
jgi:hypothetical protein